MTNEKFSGVSDLQAGYTLGHEDVRLIKHMAARLLAAETQLAAQQVDKPESIEYFAYSDSTGFETFTIAADAINAAQAVIDACREDEDGWPEAVDTVCWGIVMQRARKTELRPVKGDHRFPVWVKEAEDYELLPERAAQPTIRVIEDIATSPTPSAGNYPVIPDGLALVPREIYLDASAIELICGQCGDGGHMFGDFTDGILWVGSTADTPPIYGLHISTADYPEEGCITLAEFPKVHQHDLVHGVAGQGLQ